MSIDINAFNKLINSKDDYIESTYEINNIILLKFIKN